jgi:hypothetical protein
MHRRIRQTLLMLVVALLVLPAALSDAHERHGPVDRAQPTRAVAYVFHGTFHVADSSLSVLGGNRQVRRAGFVGQTVAFDLSAARVRVADVNADGRHDAADLHEGDVVAIKARAPRRSPHAAPFAARWVVAQPHRHRHGQ